MPPDRKWKKLSSMTGLKVYPSDRLNTICDRKLIAFACAASAFTPQQDIYASAGSTDPSFLYSGGKPTATGIVRAMRATFCVPGASGDLEDPRFLACLGLKITPSGGPARTFPIASMLNGIFAAAKVSTTTAAALMGIGGGMELLEIPLPLGDDGDVVQLVYISASAPTFTVAGRLVIELLGEWDAAKPSLSDGSEHGVCSCGMPVSAHPRPFNGQPNF